MAACGTGCGGGVWALGTAAACGRADVVGGDWVAELCCPEAQRKPHFGQYLDLWGRGSRQCGHSIVPQFSQNCWPGDICEWQTEQRVILGCTLLSFSGISAPLAFPYVFSLDLQSIPKTFSIIHPAKA
jgi:hypothetical protein